MSRKSKAVSARALPLQNHRKEGVLAADDIEPWPVVEETCDKVSFPFVLARVKNLPVRSFETNVFSQVLHAASQDKSTSSAVPVGWIVDEMLWKPPSHNWWSSRPAAALYLPRTKNDDDDERIGVFADEGEHKLFALLHAISGVVRASLEDKATYFNFRAEKAPGSSRLCLVIEVNQCAFTKVENASYSVGMGSSWRKNSRCFRRMFDELINWNAVGFGPDCCEDTLNFLGGVRPSRVADRAEGSSPSSSSVEQRRRGKAKSQPSFSVAHILSTFSSSESVEQGGATERVQIEGLTTSLKHYQEEGIAWMLRRERRPNTLSLHPCWQQIAPAGPGPFVYAHRITGEISLQFPVVPEAGTCGGMLCDDVGLGKSVQVLGLILANPAPASFLNPDASPAATAQRGSERPAREMELEPLPEALPPGCPARLPATLLVCPASLLGQWEEELRKHVARGALRYCTYVGQAAKRPRKRPHHEPEPEPEQAGGGAAEGDGEGSSSRLHRSRRIKRSCRADAEQGAAGGGGRGREEYEVLARSVEGLFRSSDGARVDGARLREWDLVLVAYETLQQELRQCNHHDLFGSPLAQLAFWRIVLDEAQMVASSSGRAALICSALWRSKAWVVTGTPIQAKVSEVCGLLSFLDHRVFQDDYLWKQLIENRVVEKKEEGLHRLRAVLHSLMLRRHKHDPRIAAQLALPQLRWEVHHLQLTDPESKAVDGASNRLQATYAEWRRVPSTAPSNRKMRMTARLNGDLTRLRQTICHPSVVNQDRQNAKLAAKEAAKTRVEILTEMAQRATKERVAAVAEAAWVGAVAVAADALMRLERATQHRGEDCAGDGSGGDGVGEGAPEERVRQMAAKLRDRLLQEADGCEYGRWEPTAMRMEELAHTVGRAEVMAQREASKPKQKHKGGKADKKKATAEEKEEDKRRAELQRGLEREVQGAFGSKWREPTRRSGEVGKREKEQEVCHSRCTYFRQLLATATEEQQRKRKPPLQPAPSAKKCRLDNGTAAEADAQDGQEEGWEEAMCPICLDVRAVEEAGEEWSITTCGHGFCFECISGLLAASSGASAPCPVCKTTLTKAKIHKLSAPVVNDEGPEQGEGEGEGAKALEAEWGSKVCGLLAVVGEELASGGKVLVFSAWTRLLALAQQALEANGVACATLAGSLASKQRALATFTRRVGAGGAAEEAEEAGAEGEEAPGVLLIPLFGGASGGAGGGAAGLTLTEASAVVLLEPALQSGIEQQAAGRIHRIGQPKAGRVVRLICQGTIEDKILEWQQAKAQTTDDRGPLALADLVRLLEH